MLRRNKPSLPETYTLSERTLKGLFDGMRPWGFPRHETTGDQRSVGSGKRVWAKFKPIVSMAPDYKTTSIPKDKISFVGERQSAALKEMNKA